MSDKKPTSKKQDTKPKQAPKGKVKGQGEVKPADPARATEKTARHAAAAKEGADALKAGTTIHAAYEAGRRASETGTPGKPPAEYSDVEVRAWFEGYKSHANPNAETTVDGIEKGYRSKY